MDRHMAETTTGATRNVPLPVFRQQAQGFVLGKYHASSGELCMSCIYFVLPKAKKTTLKVLFRFLRP
jgi:hypothetical protein